MGDTAGFVRHRANTGTVFAGTGTVWKNPTRGIPVTSPTNTTSQTGNLVLTTVAMLSSSLLNDELNSLHHFITDSHKN
jgi:hypothetical protein